MRVGLSNINIEREKNTFFFFGKQTREKLFEFLKGGGVIFVYPIEHRICGLSLVIAIFFFFPFRVGYLCAYNSVVCVSLCNQLGLFGLVDEFFFF